jgi:hypothetical protein
MIDLDLVLVEANGKIIHIVHEHWSGTEVDANVADEERGLTFTSRLSFQIVVTKNLDWRHLTRIQSQVQYYTPEQRTTKRRCAADERRNHDFEWPQVVRRRIT